MRWDVVAWAVIALVLMAAETMAPGAFMLWMGFAAAAMFVVVLFVPGLSILAQVVLFAALSMVFVLAYRRWFQRREPASDRPLLNRRAAQMIGRVIALDQSIVAGRGRVKLDDAYWVVEGPDLVAGTPVRVIGSDGMTLKVQPAE